MQKKLPPELKLRRLLIISGTIAAAITLLSCLNAGDAIEDYLARRAEFTVRSFIGRDPPLSPKLKIFIFDDQTVDAIKKSELDLNDWGLIFVALAKTHPRHIIVDKLFTMPIGIESANHFNEAIAHIEVPILTGGFSTEKQIANRKELVLGQPWNQVTALARGDEPPRQAWPLPPSKRIYAYGPNREIDPVLNHVGLIDYAGGGRVRPLTRLDATRIIPHLSLLIADQLQTSMGQLVVNGRELKVHNGLLQVNLPSNVDFMGRSYSMKPLVEHSRLNDAISVVDPGDEVLILPAMATGNTDEVMTPRGQLPGSYLVAGLLNSVLTDKWLQEIGSPIGFIWLGGALGMLAVLAFFRRKGLWFALGGGGLAIVGLGLISFCYFGYIVPWLYPALTFLLTGVAIFAERSRVAQLQQAATERELATASLVQRAFFPRAGHETKALTVVGHFQPVTQCGGDWWWHFSPRPGVDYVLIGDVMGHGMSSALVTALMYAGLSTLIDQHGDKAEWPTPVQILAVLNRLLFNALHGEVIMTMFAACFDTTTQTLTYTNAGHRFPIFLPSAVPPPRPVHGRPKAGKRGQTDIAVTQLVLAGHVIGLVEECLFVEQKMDLMAGDRFIFYTDGVLEHLTPERRAWGQKAFLTRVVELARVPPQLMIDGLLQTISGHMADIKQEDDYTLVVVEVPAG